MILTYVVEDDGIVAGGICIWHEVFRAVGFNKCNFPMLFVEKHIMVSDEVCSQNNAITKSQSLSVQNVLERLQSKAKVLYVAVFIEI